MHEKINKWRLFLRGVHLSFTNLWRNKFLSIASIIVIATIVFILNIILSIDFTVQSTLKELNEKVDLIVYVQDKDPSTITGLMQNISKIEGVSSVKYTSKEEALEQIKKLHPETVQFIKNYKIENPLPPSISISTTNPNRHEAIIKYINTNFPNIVSSINQNNTEQSKRNQRILDNLNEVQDFTNFTIFWILIVLMIGGALIILNSLHITIFSRQKELSIMRFIGTSHNFIRIPYILEAVWYSILAVTLSLIMLIILTWFIPAETAALKLWTTSNGAKQEIIILEFLITIAISIISSFIAIERYLRKKLLA